MTLRAWLLAALLCLVAAAPVQAAAPSGSYSGKVKGTGAGQKVRFGVSDGRVRSVRARVTLTCNGPYATVTYKLRGSAKVRGNRRFRLSKRVTVRTKGGSVFRARITVSGRFNRAGSRAAGTVRGSGTLVEPATPLVGGLAEPGETSKCASPPGRQTFRAKRR